MGQSILFQALWKFKVTSKPQWGSASLICASGQSLQSSQPIPRTAVSENVQHTQRATPSSVSHVHADGDNF